MVIRAVGSRHEASLFFIEIHTARDVVLDLSDWASTTIADVLKLTDGIASAMLLYQVCWVSRNVASTGAPSKGNMGGPDPTDPAFSFEIPVAEISLSTSGVMDSRHPEIRKRLGLQ